MFSLPDDQHLKDLQTANGVVDNPNKCLLGVTSLDFLDFLGHHIDQHGSTPLPDKVQAAQSQRQLRLRRSFTIVFYLTVLCADLMRVLTSCNHCTPSFRQPNPKPKHSFNDALANAPLLSPST